MLEDQITPDRYRYLYTVNEEREKAAAMPFQPFTPDELNLQTSRAAKETLGRFLHEPSSSDLRSLVKRLKSHITPERRLALKNVIKNLEEAEKPCLDVLTPEEREHLEEQFAKSELKSLSEVGLNCLAHFTLQTPAGDLSFEASIEDDGTCLTLLTPYDERDGEFIDLDRCITDWW